MKVCSFSPSAVEQTESFQHAGFSHFYIWQLQIEAAVAAAATICKEVQWPTSVVYTMKPQAMIVPATESPVH